MIVPIRFQPRYGGPSVTIHDDGRIEVDGYGVIKIKWKTAIDKWRPLITKAAAARGVPEAWIAGFMYCESGGQQMATSPVGAIGLMQIMGSTPDLMFHEHYSREELYQPDLNIDMGARILSVLAENQAWNVVHVAAKYNSGGVYAYTGKNCPHDGLWHIQEGCGYGQCVVGAINSAIDQGYSGVGASGASSSWWKALAFVVGIAIPVAVVTYYKRGR